MRLALTLVVLLVPSFAVAETTEAVAARLRAEASRSEPSVLSTATMATGGVGSSPRVLAGSGDTTVNRPSCGSRGVLVDPRTKSSSSCSNSSSCSGWSACGRGGGWNGGGCAPSRTCGGAGSVVVLAPTVIVVGGGGCTGSWGATTSTSTSAWGWGGGNGASRPRDIRVSWHATDGGR